MDLKWLLQEKLREIHLDFTAIHSLITTIHYFLSYNKPSIFVHLTAKEGTIQVEKYIT